MIKRALISVFDKTGLDKLAEALFKAGIEIFASGGTAAFLKKSGCAVTELETITGFSDMLEGRVKTLHPMIFGGILADPGIAKHAEDIKKFNIQKFDMVVVNLYPFEEKVVGSNLPPQEAIEWIDIGGSALIRASAKNFAHVAILISPNDYPAVIDYINTTNDIPYEFKMKLAQRAFEFTSYYDAMVSNYFAKGSKEFPVFLTLPLKKVQEPRYGENPHQKSCIYRQVAYGGTSIIDMEQLHGKEMSFNNYIDVQAAYDLVNELPHGACAIIKHTNPCGAAVGVTSLDAYKKALSTDTDAAFGGVIAFNIELDAPCAQEISAMFTECIIAPSFTQEALDILKTKKNVRLLKLPQSVHDYHSWDIRRVKGGFLVQEWDIKGEEQWKVVTERQPTEYEKKALSFAWTLVKHIKSNAIVFTTDTQTIGVGAGQMSRVDSVKLAKMKARSALKNTVCASDAFFPFKDNVEEIALAGATAIIQPGGSIRDEDSIQEANKQGLVMIFTGARHFKH